MRGDIIAEKNSMFKEADDHFFTVENVTLIVGSIKIRVKLNCYA